MCCELRASLKTRISLGFCANIMPAYAQMASGLEYFCRALGNSCRLARLGVCGVLYKGNKRRVCVMKVEGPKRGEGVSKGKKTSSGSDGADFSSYVTGGAAGSTGASATQSIA